MLTQKYWKWNEENYIYNSVKNNKILRNKFKKKIKYGGDV